MQMRKAEPQEVIHSLGKKWRNRRKQQENYSSSSASRENKVNGQELKMNLPSISFLPILWNIVFSQRDKQYHNSDIGIHALNVFTGLSTLYSTEKVACLNIFGYKLIFFLHPESAKEVLKSNSLINRDSTYDFFKPVFGYNSFICSSDDNWRRRRKYLAPHAHVWNLKDDQNVFMEHSNVLVEKLKQLQKNEIFDILEWMKYCTLDIIADIAVGVSLHSQTTNDQEYVSAIHSYLGLDPAEPFFQGLPPSVRLDETDARFVDVIHTDSKSILLLGLGMSQAIGHVDFYPNNGKDQPGCFKNKFISIFTEGLIESSRRFIGCNHQRAVDFFHWSINNNHCRLVGYKCASWEQFLEGKCTDCAPDGSLCSTMGIRADERKTLNETNVKFYLKTSGDSPFCLQHYKIVFKLHKSKQATAVKGSVAIELHGDQENVLTKLTGGSRELHPGSTHFYLATTDKNLIKIKSVLFSWTDSSSLLNPINWIRTKKLYLEYIEVIPMNVVDKIEQRSLTTKLCPTDPFKPIYSKKPAVLLEVNCKN
ncbi:lipase member H-A-like [Centruroides sculpturatus]|uniref:lipase member H-A-like n=1 Tax=Centruroides sculpturatus TaxID=218467 RepID=UPI000C6E0A4D|nr:lipase member H-A-like [Centruroides sculpturatus]